LRAPRWPDQAHIKQSQLLLKRLQREAAEHEPDAEGADAALETVSILQM
jgi:hypothetical protein